MSIFFLLYCIFHSCSFLLSRSIWGMVGWMDAIDPQPNPTPSPVGEYWSEWGGSSSVLLSLLTKAACPYGWLVAWLHVAAGINEEAEGRKEGNAMQLLMRKIWDTRKMGINCMFGRDQYMPKHYFKRNIFVDESSHTFPLFSMTLFHLPDFSPWDFAQTE